jgi:hypothetical protein
MQKLQPTKLVVVAAGLLVVIYAVIWLRLKYLSGGGIKE